MRVSSFLYGVMGGAVALAPFEAKRKLKGGCDKAAGKKVLVVGAGLSGLVTAREILKKDPSVRVYIFEGSDKAGGRTKSVFVGGYNVDIGGQWVLDFLDNQGYDTAQVLDLLKEMNPNFDEGPSREIADGLPIFPKNGGLDPDAPTHAQIETWQDEFTRQCRRSWNQADSRKMTDSANTIADRTSSENWTPQQLEWLEQAYMSVEYGAGRSDAWAGTCWEGTDYDNDPKHLTLRDGIQPLIDWLVADVKNRGATIRYNRKVFEVRYRKKKGNVRAKYLNSAGETKNWNGDRVVMTASIGVLQSGAINFRPRLPSAHQDAIDALGMGRNGKTYVVFESAWWFDMPNIPEFNAVWGQVTDNGSPFIFPFLDLPILFAFQGGAYTDVAEAVPDDQVKDKIMAELRSMFGDYVPAGDPVAVYQTRWGQDEFTRGSYSYLREPTPQNNPYGSSARYTLATPVEGNGWPQDSLFFAGEHTSATLPALMNGAIQSGIDTANNICG